MENRLCLNKRPVYELPDEVIVGEYIKRPNKKRCKTPNFKPDICLNSKYNIRLDNAFNTKDQIWIETNNADLIDFIRGYNWRKNECGITAKSLSINNFKKIILEEFYNVRE